MEALQEFIETQRQRNEDVYQLELLDNVTEEKLRALSNLSNSTDPYNNLDTAVHAIGYAQKKTSKILEASKTKHEELCMIITMLTKRCSLISHLADSVKTQSDSRALHALAFACRKQIIALKQMQLNLQHQSQRIIMDDVTMIATFQNAIGDSLHADVARSLLAQ